MIRRLPLALNSVSKPEASNYQTLQDYNDAVA